MLWPVRPHLCAAGLRHWGRQSSKAILASRARFDRLPTLAFFGFRRTAIPTAHVFAYEVRMALTLEQVQHVAKLAELELTPGELERLATDLSAILAHVDQLQNVTAERAASSGGEAHAAPVRLRPDEPRRGIAHDRALLPAPKVLDEGFAVPAFVDD